MMAGGTNGTERRDCFARHHCIHGPQRGTRGVQGYVK